MGSDTNYSQKEWYIIYIYQEVTANYSGQDTHGQKERVSTKTRIKKIILIIWNI